MCILEFLNLTNKKSTLQIVFACLNIGCFTNSSIFNSEYPPSEMHLLFKFYQILLNYSHHCTVRNSNFLQTNLESPGKINFHKESAALYSFESIRDMNERKCEKLPVICSGLSILIMVLHF